MALRGKFETEQLRKNIKSQLNRLLMQMSDLEQFKDEFDSIQEWEEEKKETELQLKEFQAFLNRTLSGDMTLVDEFSSVQIAIQETISNAFKTPDIIRLFAAKEPDRLRTKLKQLHRDVKTKKIKKKMYLQQQYEILLALQKLGSKLNKEEQSFIKQYQSRGLASAQQISSMDATINRAKSQISKAQD
eukprot:210844_1